MRVQLRSILLLSLWVTLPTCKDEDTEVGGSHGDIDMLMEEDLTQPIDIPPDISDPMMVREAIKANPKTPYFGFSHLTPLARSGPSGQAYFALRNDGGYLVNVNMIKLGDGQNARLVLSTRPCESHEHNVDRNILGHFEADDYGRVHSAKISFESSKLEGIDLSLCEKQAYTSIVVSAGEKIIACGSLDCVRTPTTSSH